MALGSASCSSLGFLRADGVFSLSLSLLSSLSSFFFEALGLLVFLGSGFAESAGSFFFRPRLGFCGGAVSPGPCAKLWLVTAAVGAVAGAGARESVVLSAMADVAEAMSMCRISMARLKSIFDKFDTMRYRAVDIVTVSC